MSEHDLRVVEGLIASAAAAGATRMSTAANPRAGDLMCTVVEQQLASGGKRLRARLALDAAAALGVDPARAAPWAAAVECLHNATLVHDDVQDGDTVRRGVPTAWVTHGVPQAINAGDLMLMMPVARLIDTLDASDATKWHLARALTRSAERVVRGQAADLSLLARCLSEPRLDVKEAWVACARDKTAALFSVCVEGAALLAHDHAGSARSGSARSGSARSGSARSGSAHGDLSPVDAAAPFFAAGVAFQLVDDVIDLYGDKGRNAVGNDIREGKISVLVAEHVRQHPDSRGALLALLARGRDGVTDGEVSSVIDTFAAGGALAASFAMLDALVDDAHRTVAPPLAATLTHLLELVLHPTRRIRGDAVAPTTRARKRHESAHAGETA